MECNNYDTPNVKRGIIKRAMIVLSSLSIATVVVAILFLPQIVDYYQDLTNIVLGYSYVIFMWITSIPFITMLVFFLLISLMLNRKGVFSSSVLRHIKGIQICLMIEVCLYIYGIIYYRLILTAVILFGAIILLVLSTLFKEVIKDGEEYYTDSSLSV